MHALLAEVLVDQGVDRLDPNIGRDVAGLQLAHELVDVHAVADFDGDPGQVGVGVVHRVAELERRHGRPAALFERFPRLGGSLVEALELRGEVRLREHLDGAGEIDFGLLHHQLDAGVRGVFGPEDLLALVVLVDRVLLRDLHGRHQGVGLGVPEGDLLTDGDRVGQGPRGREGDRDRPEQVLLRGHAVLVADPLPVVVAHEPVERREAADPHHDEIAGFAAGQGNLLQLLGLANLAGQRRALEEQRLQSWTAMRWDQFAHDTPPFSVNFVSASVAAAIPPRTQVSGGPTMIRRRPAPSPRVADLAFAFPRRCTFRRLARVVPDFTG